MMTGADALARDEQRAMNQRRVAEKNARLLARLSVPMTAAEVARDFGMSAGGALRKLKQLEAEGVLTSHRSRYERYFVRVEMADKLSEVA